MTGTVITVAPTGAESSKAAVPALPVTLDELVSTAKECEALGASIIHVHIRDAAAEPTLDQGRLRATVAALRESTDLIVQLSSGGAVTDPESDRLAVLDAGPEMASCTMGTVNFGDGVFLNRWEFIVDLHTRMQERGIVPEYEIFDLGQLTTLQRLLGQYGLPVGGHVHVDLVMGVPGGMPGTAAALVACEQAHPRPAGGHHVLGDRHRPHARSRSCSPRCRPAATCGSAWRTPSRTRRAARSSRTCSWSPGRSASPSSPSARR